MLTDILCITVEWKRCPKLCGSQVDPFLLGSFRPSKSIHCSTPPLLHPWACWSHRERERKKERERWESMDGFEKSSWKDYHITYLSVDILGEVTDLSFLEWWGNSSHFTKKERKQQEAMNSTGPAPRIMVVLSEEMRKWNSGTYQHILQKLNFTFIPNLRLVNNLNKKESRETPR